MVSRILVAAALGLTLAQAAITNVGIQGAPTPTQAVLAYTAPDNNPCVVAVSESSTLTPLDADLDPTLYTGANTDLLRDGTFASGQVRRVVVGKRAAELALDGRLHSRALQAFTTHYYQITCGTSQASGTFVTTNPPFGDTYNDPVFDRTRPGEYAFATINWSDITQTYVDPHSGVLTKRMTGPGELVPSVATGLTFSSAAALGAGWTLTGLQGTYSGSRQTPLYYRSSDPMWPGGASGKTPDFAQINLVGASGAAAAVADRTVNLCLTNNGVTCTGQIVQQALTQTSANYVVGTTTPILDFWRGSPDVPSTGNDMRVLNGAVTVAGDNVTVTWQNGDLFSLNWAPGSLITLDGVDCAIQSVGNENTLKLVSPSCTTAGAHAFAGRNWGVLISKFSTSTDAITITCVIWNLGTSGYSLFPAGGGYDLCSPVATPGPTGNGYLCVNGGTFAQYLSSNTIFWMGDDGTVNPIGMGNGSSAALTGGYCSSSTGWAWDRTTAGLFYCLGVRASDGAPVVFSVQYTGPYTPIVVPIDERLTPATTTVLSGPIPAMVAALNPAYSSFTCGSGWTLVGREHDNLVLECSQTSQNSPAWVAIYSIPQNAMIAATSTYGGTQGAANRWGDAHSVFTVGDNDWVLVSDGSVGDLTFQTQIVGGGLTPTYSNCPLTGIDPSAAGKAQCSVVTVSSLTPTDPTSGQSLFGQQLLAGDFFQVMAFNGSSWVGDGETVRILVLSGQQLTLERVVRSYSYGVNNNHTGNLALQVAPGALHEIWWDYVDDPLGQALNKPYGLTLLEDPETFDCHQVYNLNAFLAGCLKVVPTGKLGTALRPGPLPISTSTTNTFNDPLLFINFDAGFGGNNYEISTSALESHPSESQYTASTYEQSASYDGRPYMGDYQIATSSTVTKIAGKTYLYKLAASATSNLNPRLQALLMTSGTHPVVDVSPAVLQDAPVDNYKGCYVLNANDCQAGSVPGEVYMNVPFAAAPYCFLSRFSPTPTLSDVCITLNTVTAHHIIQSGEFFDDNNGALVRRLTRGFSPYKTEIVYWNVRALPDAKWVYWVSTNVGGVRNELMMLKPPPLPGLQSVNRGTFINVPIKLGPAAGMLAARARFGYAENGASSSFYCTPRQVACTTSAPAGTPFVWSDETQLPQSCTTGCTVNIPVIPGRVVYYVIERQAASGAWSSGATQAIAVK